jgi:uncharacterized protein
VRPVTLITGASAGLGASFARACSRRGDELVLVARRKERLDALVDEVGKAHAIALDLSTTDAPRRLAEMLDMRGLHVATLINNAGFGLAGRFADLPLDRQAEMIDLNIRTLTVLTRLLLPGMIERNEGAILNVASTAAFQPGPGIAVYFASKAFVLSFTEALHQELRDTEIKVSALCPGPTRTEFGAVAGVTSASFDRFSADADSVVRAGLKGLDCNDAVIIPGLVNKLGAQGGRLMPRGLMRRIVASLKL